MHEKLPGVDFRGDLHNFPGTVEIEAETAHVVVLPLSRLDHRQQVFPFCVTVKVIHLTNHRFDAELGVVDELVPIEAVDGT